MELSIIRLHDSPLGGPLVERRRRIRHKLHTPVYASFNGPNSGMVLDLSELLDLHEEGFAVQTSVPLRVNRTVNLSLDLPETKAYIQGTGQVVWSDGNGRGGIRFTGLPDHARRQLKEWLFVNLLIACTKQASRIERELRPEEKKPPTLRAVPPPPITTPVPDLTGMLSAVEAVRREVRAAGDDLNAVLHLITERALSLTGASGAALAFLTGDKMICRASAGEPRLPLGTPVDAKEGLSGECVRSGRMVACGDAETDPRVDGGLCRMLGIGSILASPIFSDFRVVGLLEVFSPRSRAFTEVHETALDRLVEIVPKTKPETTKPEAKTAPVLKTDVTTKADSTTHADLEATWEPAQEPLDGVPVRFWHIILLTMVLGALALVAGYLLQPKIDKLWQSKPAPASNQTVAPAGTAQAATAPVPRPRTLDDLRKLAERGDAEAQWDMGFRYRNGEGVLQDDVKAAQWFQRAADQGHLNAQNAMGAFYWAGRGVPKDLSKSYFWSVLAANQGDETSESRLQGLATQMTPAEVAAAQQQADDWLRQHRAAK